MLGRIAQSPCRMPQVSRLPNRLRATSRRRLRLGVQCGRRCYRIVPSKSYTGRGFQAGDAPTGRCGPPGAAQKLSLKKTNKTACKNQNGCVWVLKASDIEKCMGAK